MSDRPQSFENHAKIVPGYHRWATALVTLPTLYFAYRAAFAFSWDGLLLFLFMVGVILLGFYARAFPLRVQDRLIRLEERLRMERLLPDDLRGRVGELSTRQLVGLRFASDEELADLVRRVLDENVTDVKEIKRAVKSWRPDHDRM
jgi:hypothetical protein